jgi:hypothetical protein
VSTLTARHDTKLPRFVPRFVAENRGGALSRAASDLKLMSSSSNRGLVVSRRALTSIFDPMLITMHYIMIQSMHYLNVNSFKNH